MEEKATKYSHTAKQDVWLYFRDIGFFNDVKKEFDIETQEEQFGDTDLYIWDDSLQQAI